MAEILGLAHYIGGRAAESLYDGVHPAAVDREHAAHQANQHNHRDKVRQVGDGLRHALKAFAGDAVHHQRQDDGHGEARQQIVEIQDQRIADDVFKVVGFKKVTEPFETYPRAASDAVGKVEIAEGNLHAVHGPVVEDRNIEEGGQDHQVQGPVLHGQLPGVLPVRFPSIACFDCFCPPELENSMVAASYYLMIVSQRGAEHQSAIWNIWTENAVNLLVCSSESCSFSHILFQIVNLTTRALRV